MTTSLEALTPGSGAPVHAGLSLSQKTDQIERSEDISSLKYGSTSDKTMLETSGGSSHALANIILHNPADDDATTARMLHDAGLTPTKVSASPSGLKASMARLSALKAARGSPKTTVEIKGPFWDRDNCSVTKADHSDGHLPFLTRLRDVFSGVFSEPSNLELTKINLVLITLGSYLDELRTNYAGYELAAEIVSCYEQVHNTWSRVIYSRQQESADLTTEGDDDDDLMSMPNLAPRKESAVQTTSPAPSVQPLPEWSDDEDGDAAASSAQSIEESSKKESKAKNWLAPAVSTISGAAAKTTRNKQMQRTASVSGTSSDSEITVESPTTTEEVTKGVEAVKCATGARVKFKTEAGQTVTCFPPKDFQSFAKAGKFAFIICTQGEGWIELVEDFVPKNLEDIKAFAKEQVKGYKRSGTLVMPTHQQVTVKEGKEVFSKFYTSNVTRFANSLPTMQFSVLDAEGFTTTVSSDISTADTLKTLMSRIAKLESDSAQIPKLISELDVCKAVNTSLADALEASLKERDEMQVRLELLERKMMSMERSLEDQGKSIGYVGGIATEVKQAMSFDGTLQNISDIAELIDGVAASVNEVDAKVEAVNTNAASALATVSQHQAALNDANDAVVLLLDTVSVIEATNQSLVVKVDGMQGSLNTVATLSKSVASLTGRVGHLGNMIKDPGTHSLPVAAAELKPPPQAQSLLRPPALTTYAPQAKASVAPQPAKVQVQPVVNTANAPLPTFPSKARKPQELNTQQVSQSLDTQQVPQSQNPFLSSTVSEYLKRAGTRAAQPPGVSQPVAGNVEPIMHARGDSVPNLPLSMPINLASDLTPATSQQLASLQKLLNKRNIQLAQTR